MAVKPGDQTAKELSTGEVVVDVSHPEAFAQERDRGTSNEYGVGTDESNGSILDAVITEQAVSISVPALLFGFDIHTALTGTLTVKGLLNVSGVPTDHVYPIGTVGPIDLKGAKCNSALACTLSVATDDVIVLWRPKGA